jgi:putative peptidoglycan lipid II flippase
LNAGGAFIVPASNWPLANVIFFLLIFLGHFFLHADALIWAALSGPLAMLALNLWILSGRDTFRWHRPRLSSQAFVQALRLARPVAATLGIGSGLGLLMASHLLVRQYGSWFGEGAVSALSYAFRLYEVPITLVTATAGTLVLPVFAKLYHEDQILKIASLSREMLGWGLVILLPIAAFVAIDAQWIVSILFHWGSFTQESATLTAEALRSFAPAILFEAVFMVFFRAIYSIHRPGVSVMVGLATLATLYVLLRFVSGLNVFSWMALSLTGSFAIAAVLCITAVGRLLRQPIFPAKRDTWFAVLAVAGAGTALYVWEHHGGPSSMTRSLIGAAGFAAIYLAIVRFFLPQRWKQLLELVHKLPRRQHPAI